MSTPTDDDLLDWLHDLPTVAISGVRALAAARIPPWIVSVKARLGCANAAIMTPSTLSRDGITASLSMRVIAGIDTADGLEVILNYATGTEASLIGTLYERNPDTLAWYYEIYTMADDRHEEKNLVLSTIYGRDIYGSVLIIKNGPAASLYSPHVRRLDVAATLWYYHVSGRDPKGVASERAFERLITAT
ncbi:hypothetical protein B0H15DRAFT_951665 [Mycena belliarum]|uniref:Uncharacterized protein n=1 Tax=Mycena belliarum TaxID=1033014 RepID=A0AAD6U289_9AGAR|nr:hypothetical protein B0H15DRAFT_951665 [Mycena belliae]